MLKITLIVMVSDSILIFFARSKLRLEVLKKLNEKPRIASFLAHSMKKHRESISRVFLDLQEKGLAKCTNPKAPHFRYYAITKKGKKILEEVSSKTQNLNIKYN